MKRKEIISYKIWIILALICLVAYIAVVLLFGESGINIIRSGDDGTVKVTFKELIYDLDFVECKDEIEGTVKNIFGADLENKKDTDKLEYRIECGDTAVISNSKAVLKFKKALEYADKETEATIIKEDVLGLTSKTVKTKEYSEERYFNTKEYEKKYSESLIPTNGGLKVRTNCKGLEHCKILNWMESYNDTQINFGLILDNSNGEYDSVDKLERIIFGH